jgi:hypothetical protein
VHLSQAASRVDSDATNAKILILAVIFPLLRLAPAYLDDRGLRHGPLLPTQGDTFLGSICRTGRKKGGNALRLHPAQSPV